jgi:uncharacterized protein (TIGR03083 family)
VDVTDDGELSSAYHATRSRVSELLAGLDTGAAGATVPACPDWTVHDLVAHMVGLPEALTSGDLPGADLQGWLDGLVAVRRDVPVAELLRRWEACTELTSSLVDGGADALLVDLVVHEHDLRGALARPGARDAPELVLIVPLLLDALAPALETDGVAPLAVDTGSGRWQSHEGAPGCTMHVDPWLASRALESRRTAEELRALTVSGDVAPYVAVIAGHLPLPERPLRE